MKSITDQIKSLMAEGFGRRSIAKALSMSEWAVRKIQRELVGTGHAKFAQAGRPTVEAPVRVSKTTQHPTLSHVSPTVEKIKEAIKAMDDQSCNHTVFRPDVNIEVVSEALIEDVVKPILPKIINKPTTKVTRSMIKERILVISDTHVPFEDKKAMELFYAYAGDNMPDRVVLLGDILDLYSVSKYDKVMRGKMRLPEEIEAGKEFVAQIRDFFPDAKITMVGGNHSARLQAYLIKYADQLVGLPGTTIPELLDLEGMDIDYYAPGQYMKIGELVFTHGTLARKGAGSSVRGMNDKYKESLIMGHCHKMSTAYVRTLKGHQIMIENATMAGLEQDYGVHMDFIQGFTEIFMDESGMVTAHGHAIRNYKLVTPSGVVYEIN